MFTMLFTTISCGNTLLLRSSTGELSDLALLARPINSGRSSAAQHEKSGNVEGVSGKKVEILPTLHLTHRHTVRMKNLITVRLPVVRMDGTDLGGVFGGSDRGDEMNVVCACFVQWSQFVN